nr:hypothetical protein BaRGS_017070 [Batillaria attramentaria]
MAEYLGTGNRITNNDINNSDNKDIDNVIHIDHNATSANDYHDRLHNIDCTRYNSRADVQRNVNIENVIHIYYNVKSANDYHDRLHNCDRHKFKQMSAEQ